MINGHAYPQRLAKSVCGMTHITCDLPSSLPVPG